MLSTQVARTALLVTSALSLAPLARASDVLVVDASGGTPYAEIQHAVDVAADGDVVLVRAGAYAGFVIDSKGLAVVADRDAEVGSGPIELVAVPGDSFVLLAGLQAAAQDRPGLWVRGCDGSIRVQVCTLQGGVGEEDVYEDGWAGAYVDASMDVIFTDCELLGGTDAGTDFDYGDQAGAGLQAVGSSVALYGCRSIGAQGANAVDYDAGNGGHGVFLESSFLFCSGGELRGGRGGSSYFDCGSSGRGGNGLDATLGAEAQLLDAQLVAGFAGPCNSCFICTCCITPGDGQPQLADGTSTIETLPGTAHHLSLPYLSHEQVVELGAVEGEEGEHATLAQGTAPDFSFVSGAGGVVAIEGLSGPRQVLGELPPAGGLLFQLEAPELAAGSQAEVTFLQSVFVDFAAGARVVGSPVTRVVLDCSLSPDCNANGVADACESASGAVQDCDRDGVPDECQPFQDCNQNGQHDPCEILLHPGLDCDLSGGLDECEDQRVTLSQGLLVPDGLQPDTWYGDAVAVGGGVLAIGAPLDEFMGDYAGAVYVYERGTGAGFELTQKLRSPAPGQDSSQFGTSVALRDRRLLVGTFNNVFVFERDTLGSWSVIAELSQDPPHSYFGLDVAWGDDGTIFVGAPAPSGPHMTSVYVYEESAPGTFSQTAQLQPSGGGSGFGAALDYTEETLFVGARGSGAVYVFGKTVNGWVEEQCIPTPDGAPVRFGERVSADEGVLAVGAGGLPTGSGEVFLYRRSASGIFELWSRLEPDDIEGPNGAFGSGLSYRAGSLWVGAPLQSQSTGAVYFYKVNVDGSSTMTGKSIPQPGAGPFAFYGLDIARTRSDTLGLVGSFQGTTAAGYTGFVELFLRLEDCNGNGIPDSCDISSLTSPDANLNGVPDECE